ncbi:uncharacterized protein C9orf85 homolog [Anthonomus grandis grandis]|uniref:uncharacterized protein C9orf85 homolog n=1 Tax=Anthonomus grandis grandis TaxID=2921223 RepID=UPI002166BAC9|nr:uncharacterized protein C9orf85 homolog [Anthonomus grandis grandis]
MSTQKGNSSRSRPQKHQNRHAFKNTLHDTSHKTKSIVSTQVSNVCQRCKEIIEWKIKYKKYKPLTQAKKCVKCELKTVKRAYHIMCDPCGAKLGVCAKCGQDKEVVVAPPSEKEQIQLDEEMKVLLKSLPERKRRTFIRYMNKSGEEKEEKLQKEDILNKLNALKVDDGDDDLDDFMGLSDDEGDEHNSES